MAICPFCASQVDAAPGVAATCNACGAVFTPGAAMPESKAPPPAMPAGIPSPPPAPEIPCPMCGEMIKAGARICRFCKSPLDGGRPVAPPSPAVPRPYGGPAMGGPAMVAPKKSHCLLWIVIFVVVGIAVVCVGGGIMFWVYKDKVMGEACKQYLEQIGQGAVKYSRKAGPDDSIDKLTGHAFCKRMAQEMDNEQIMFCPAPLLKGKQAPYRGPRKPWSKMSDNDVVACDEAGNHEKGIYVLLKNGAVIFAETDTDLYKRALAETTNE